MWDWVIDNSDGLSVVVSLVTMLVWVAYFQILYAGFKRQRRTRILINRGAGQTTQSRCLISNMGAEPLYVMSIIATLEKGDQRVTSAITDLDSTEVDETSPSREATNQGPLLSGDFMDVGRFSDLMARCARTAGIDDADVERRFDAFEILVIGAYGADDLSVGASRRFVMRGSGTKRDVDTQRISTVQLRSRRARRRLEQYLNDYR